MKLLTAVGLLVCAGSLASRGAAQAQLDDLWFSRWGTGGVMGYRPNGSSFAYFNSPGLSSCVGVTAIDAEHVAVTRGSPPSRLTVFDVSGAVVVDFPLPEAASGAGDLARFSDGTFAVCDAAGEVELYSPSGAHLATWDAPSLVFPAGAWVDARDRLWVSDRQTYSLQDGRIVAFDRSGVVLHDFALSFEPGDLAVEASGEIWVTDRGFGALVQHLDAAGNVLGSFPTGMTFPVEGLGLAADGTLWVCASGWAIARHFARDGAQIGQVVVSLGQGNIALMDVVRRTQPPQSYCTAGTTTHGCVASVSASGFPSLSLASGFVVTATQVEGALSGTLFYSSTGAQALPWSSTSTSFLCVRKPMQRTLVQNSGGALGSCNGALSLDLRAWAAANPGAFGQPFVPGQELWIQAWFRDPGASRNTNLSDALVFDWMP